MKTISLWVVILSSLLISCTNDEVSTTNENASEEVDQISTGLSPTDVANPVNPYDKLGVAYEDILTIYETLDTNSDTTILRISERVSKIALQNKDLMSLNMGNNTSVVSPQEIEVLLKNPMSCLQETLAKSSMTIEAKRCLFDFINSLLLQEKEEYDIIYQHILRFEISVMNNSTFTISDKKIILSSSSLAKYILRIIKKRKDPDWKTSIGNFEGAVKGVIYSPLQGVTTAVVLDIIKQKNILSR
ncbi:hypothetical protein [Flavobacterium hydatis]|uniref:Lipoprotein n=1 Tax=Flavobacterium hydatis TaxID=991 RepID=A0A086AAP2_FLAHY|nr:hypothetical protein [Flavobacterium hydatis]KFF13756.1 hypothetical protein IW20_16870 [Flavobacterium hydatis]OXA97792.1 hypothetical protein B0A62_02745 [Flavobacterium hydatis]